MPDFPLVPGLGTAFGVAFVVQAVMAIYVLLIWGQRAPDSKWKDDDQVGIKTLAAALVMLGTLLFITGLQGLLHLLLTFKEFGTRMKEILPHLLVGAATLGGAVLFVIPRTNHAQYPKAMRLATGAITLTALVTAVWSLDQLLVTIFKWPGWHQVTGTLTTLLTAAITTVGAGYFFAKLSGIAVPEIPLPSGQPPAPPQYPPAAPGYPPAAPGYPPAAPGQYPPAPPQGGPYPPGPPYGG